MRDFWIGLMIELRANPLAIGARSAVYPWRVSRRRRFWDAEMPAGWESLANEHLGSVIRELAADEHDLYFRHLKVFGLATRFVGAGGFQLDDEHRVIISGRAAQMSRNLGIEVWDGLSQVVLFEEEVPESFAREPVGGFVLGPTVVMSWSAVLEGLRAKDGFDITIHELAHILDYRDLDYDGIPTFDRLLHHPDAKDRYLATISKEYRRLLAGEDTSALWDYAKTNRAEFFAVATEMFFENPRRLARHHGPLYDALAEYFRVNPLRR